MNYNADCTILQPTRTHSAAVAGSIAVTETTQTAQRCWLAPLSTAAKSGLLGDITPRAYNCRLHSTLALGAEWRIKATIDNETTEYEYTVLSAVKNLLGHWHLTVERV